MLFAISSSIGSDEAEIQQSILIGDLNLVCAGFFLWDFVLTFWFEWWLIRGVIHFHWPYIPYFIGRYAAVVVVVINIYLFMAPVATATTLIYKVQPAFVSVIIGCASMNLMIRAAMLRRAYCPANTRRLECILLVLTLGHWMVLFGGGTIAVALNVQSNGNRVIIHANSFVLSLPYVYTLLYDTTTLALVIVTVVITRRVHQLPLLLLKQGGLYFIVTMAANLVPTVILIMNNKPLLSEIANASLFISIVASSRTVTHLLEEYTDPPEQYRTSMGFPSARLLNVRR